MHIGRIQECLKDLHTREEALEDLHRRKKSLVSKVDPVGKQVGPAAVKKFLERERLRHEILAIDVEIKNKEASLGEWKRTKAREWMGILFGGLREHNEKGTVVALLGQNIIGNSPTETTKPDLPQAHCSGQSQVQSLAVEVGQKLDITSFVGGIGDKDERPSNEDRTGGFPGHPPPHSNPSVQPMTEPIPQPDRSLTLLNSDSPPPDQLPPLDSATLRLPLPQRSSGSTPGHQLQPYQSSTPSESGSGSDPN